MAIGKVKRTAAANKDDAAEELKAQVAAIDRVMAIISFDMASTILDANDNFLAAVGYRRDEVVGQKHSMFVDSSFAASEEYRQFWADLRAGRSKISSFRRIGKNGKKVVLQASNLTRSSSTQAT